ncbi:MAG: O-6-methylguanine DNA methyltransferase [Planctomycetota bacterium]|jgi:O-6-methylguanine DNA methyltransferase
MNNISTHAFKSPLGELFVAVDEERALMRLQFMHDVTREELEEQARKGGATVKRVKSHCAVVERQVKEYFRGKRTEFDLELRPVGTDFQKRVWKTLSEIPYGETWSYAQVAEHVKSPKAVRAVGRTNGLNPIAVVVPCHRVIGSNGSLTGYAGGLDNKRFLLDLEAGVSV